MGTIRHEILALSERWKEEPWSHIYNQALVDAAHILDEWKLVAEETVGDHTGWGKIELPKVNPGDHIAIYVRRGKEDG